MLQERSIAPSPGKGVAAAVLVHAAVRGLQLRHQDLTGLSKTRLAPTINRGGRGFLHHERNTLMEPELQTMPETALEEAQLLGILTERNIDQNEGGQA